MGKSVFNPELTPEDWLAREHDHDANVDWSELLFFGLIGFFATLAVFAAWVAGSVITSVVMVP